MLNTGRAVQALVAQVSELTTQVQLLRSPAAPPTPPSFSIPGNHSPQHEPRLPAPEKYAGDPNLCRAFLTKCSLFFSLQPLTFATEVSRVALVLTFRDAPVDRPKIGTGRFLLIMRDRQPAGFCLFFGRFFRKCEHVICVEDIRQEHNKHRKTDTMKRTAVGVTLLAHK